MLSVRYWWFIVEFWYAFCPCFSGKAISGVWCVSDELPFGSHVQAVLHGIRTLDLRTACTYGQFILTDSLRTKCHKAYYITKKWVKYNGLLCTTLCYSWKQSSDRSMEQCRIKILLLLLHNNYYFQVLCYYFYFWTVITPQTITLKMTHVRHRISPGQM